MNLTPTQNIFVTRFANEVLEDTRNDSVDNGAAEAILYTLDVVAAVLAGKQDEEGQYGALALWDYLCTARYMGLDTAVLLRIDRVLRRYVEMTGIRLPR